MGHAVRKHSTICKYCGNEKVKVELRAMTVIHTNDPTTKVLSRLYESREDIIMRITEKSTNSEVKDAIRSSGRIMMLGHGNKYGLFSVPDKKGIYRRLIVNSDYAQFLRDKECIGIWCYANEFAMHYGLHGLFSGMIISELHEALENHISATKEEIDHEMEKFVIRLRDCIKKYGLKDTPARMKELDDVKSALTKFNYSRLYYY